MSVSRPGEARQLDLFESVHEVPRTTKYGDKTRVVRSTFVCEMCGGTFPKVGRRASLCVDCYKAVPCSVDGCGSMREGAGKLCSLHRWRMRQYGTVELLERSQCSLGHCENEASCKGLCVQHYDRKRSGQRNWDRPLGQCATDKCTAQVPERHMYCDGCKRERSRQSSRRGYRNNKERELARSKEYYQANKGRFAELNREWRAGNPGYSSRTAREWREANPLRARAIDGRKAAKRREQIKATIIEPVDYRDIIREHGMVCHICNEDIADISDLHIDHVIPLSRGGSHTRENLKPSHASCNIRKSDKLLSELLN